MVQSNREAHSATLQGCHLCRKKQYPEASAPCCFAHWALHVSPESRTTPHSQDCVWAREAAQHDHCCALAGASLSAVHLPFDPHETAVASSGVRHGARCLTKESTDARDSEKDVVTVMGFSCVSHAWQGEAVHLRPLTTATVGTMRVED